MLYIICVSSVIVVAGAAALFSTRSARLKHMARTLHLHYDAHVDNPLTPLSAQTVCLFNRSLYQFRQVLTWHESGMFIRLCQMRLHNPIGKSSRECYTLATVELTRGNFTPFILRPREEGKTPINSALPPELANRFALDAPDGFQFPEQVISLLKAGPLCYLETSSYALVYHAYTTFSIEQLQPVRFRVQQFAKTLMHTDPLPEKTTACSSVSTGAELQAEALLKLHTSSSPNAMKFVYVAVGLVLVISLLWIAQYYLRQFAH